MKLHETEVRSKENYKESKRWTLLCHACLILPLNTHFILMHRVDHSVSRPFTCNFHMHHMSHSSIVSFVTCHIHPMTPSPILFFSRERFLYYSLNLNYLKIKFIINRFYLKESMGYFHHLALKRGNHHH